MAPHELLEHELAAWIGCPSKCVTVCSSGTSALHLALESLRLPPGSGVAVSDFAMIACARSISLAGLRPVFVDCGEDLNLDPEALSIALRRHGDIRAVMPVHIYGRRCDMESIRVLADRHNLAVIEDMAEAHGVAPHPGTYAACWSFYKGKTVHGEEGGCVSFRDPEKSALARQLRCLGFTPEHDFRHIPRGHNYRLADSLATLILVSLRQVGKNLAARREIEKWYDEYCPAEWRMPPRVVTWVYDFHVPGMGKTVQNAAVAALRAAGIDARHGFQPCSQQEEYRTSGEVDPASLCWRAFAASREVIYLPAAPGVVTREAARRAFEVVKGVLGEP